MMPDPSSLAAAAHLASAGDLSRVGGLPAQPAEATTASAEPAAGPRSIRPETADPLAGDQHGTRFLAPATFLNGVPVQTKDGGIDRLLVRSMTHQQADGSGSATPAFVFPERATPRDTDHVSTWFEPSTDLWTAKLSSGAAWSNVPTGRGGVSAPDDAGGSASESGKLGSHAIDDALDQYRKAQDYSVGLTLAVTLTQSTASSFKRLSQGQ